MENFEHLQWFLTDNKFGETVGSTKRQVQRRHRGVGDEAVARDGEEASAAGRAREVGTVCHTSLAVAALGPLAPVVHVYLHTVTWL